MQRSKSKHKYVPLVNCLELSCRITKYIISASLSISIVRGTLMLRTCRLAHLSVGLSVRKVYCGKTTNWIRMLFGMVSGVGQGMGVLDGVVIVKGEGAVFGVNLGRRIVTNGTFVA